MAVEDFFDSLLDKISGKAKKDLVQSQIDAAKEVAIAQAKLEEAKSSPEALAERRKLIIGVILAVAVAGGVIMVLYYKYK